MASYDAMITLFINFSEFDNFEFTPFGISEIRE